MLEQKGLGKPEQFDHRLQFSHAYEILERIMPVKLAEMGPNTRFPGQTRRRICNSASNDKQYDSPAEILFSTYKNDAE